MGAAGHKRSLLLVAIEDLVPPVLTQGPVLLLRVLALNAFVQKQQVKG